MGKINEPLKVKLIIGILAVKELATEEVKKMVQDNFGAVDGCSEIIPFNFTDYYEKGMDKNLTRFWLSIEKLISPEELSGIKVKSNQIEDGLTVNGKRKLNLDPGYLTAAKLILASTKDYSHRIYLDKGIYAEVTLIYQNGEFTFLPWTYADYKSLTALNFLKKSREIFLKSLVSSR